MYEKAGDRRIGYFDEALKVLVEAGLAVELPSAIKSLAYEKRYSLAKP